MKRENIIRLVKILGNEMMNSKDLTLGEQADTLELIYKIIKILEK